MIARSVIAISLVLCFSLAGCSMSQKGALSQAQRSYQQADFETCLMKLSQAEGYGEHSESVSADISFHRGLCLEGAGRKNEATAVYLNLIRTYPNSSGAIQAQARLANVRDISKTPAASGPSSGSNSRPASSPRTMVLLKVHVDSRHVALPGSSNLPKDIDYDAEVVLSWRYLAVSTADHLQVMDFEKRRRFSVDKKTGTYIDYSLYDTVGFRALELNNRNALDHVLAKAKIDQVSRVAGREDNEHNLAVQARPLVTISVDRDGDDTVFSAAGKPLFRNSLKGTPVSVEESTAFAQYLRYVFGGHPFILDDVAKGKLIPSSATFTFRNLAVNTVTIGVTEVQRIEAAPYDVQSYRPWMPEPSADALDALLSRASIIPLSALEAEKRKVQLGRTVALQEERFLDALLETMEFQLMTGTSPPAFSPEQATKIQSDASVQKLVKALAPGTKEQLQEAVKTFQALRRQTQTKQHMLKTFEAIDRAKLGELVVAKSLFAEALQSQPFLAGAYKDLGDVLVMGYDTFRAWRCWDIGRRIAPNFPTFSSVTEFEKKLVAEYPEYF
jgi:tetratricopeptide (TPR) repeat protein